MDASFVICSHKTVAEDGRMLCQKIVRGDREVTAALCAACPAVGATPMVPQRDMSVTLGGNTKVAPYCRHLRFSLEKEHRGAILVRYGNGKTVVWEEHPPVLRFARAACALRLVPLCSAAECAACPERAAAVPRMVGRGMAMGVALPVCSPGKVIPLPP